CVMIKPQAFDAIEDEYKKVGKAFMGAFVPRFGDSPDHLSGVAVYPPDVVTLGVKLLCVGEQIPFDLADAERTLSQAHFSDLIQHRWGRNNPVPAITERKEIYKYVTKECVLFHADKSGTWNQVLNLQGEVNRDSTPTRSGQPLSELEVKHDRQRDST